MEEDETAELFASFRERPILLLWCGCVTQVHAVEFESSGLLCGKMKLKEGYEVVRTPLLDGFL